MVQLMPLPLPHHRLRFIKIQITFLVLAYPRQVIKQVFVCLMLRADGMPKLLLVVVCSLLNLIYLEESALLSL